MLRRLHPEQPESFAFTPANQAWAEAQITKYPEGRQASAIIPLLWRAQEQVGWLTRPAIETVAEMLDMAYIRALEVATFYFMFQLAPVGSVAHVQVCGTTTCMICGAEDLIAVCREKIAARPFELSADGKFSWEEVECLGACSNAPMAAIGKDYYEDLTPEIFSDILGRMAQGEVPKPGPQNGRFSSEPKGGPVVLTAHVEGRMEHNASVTRALALGDTLKRIDGTEVPLSTPWQDRADKWAEGTAGKGTAKADNPVVPKPDVTEETPASEAPKSERPDPKAASEVSSKGKPASAPDEKPASGSASGAAKETGAAKDTSSTEAAAEGTKPATLSAPKDGKADDLKRIKGVGPKLEQLLHEMGFFHFDQIAGWTEDEIAWVDGNLEGFKGRVSRDDWVAQAKLLASGGETDFSKRVDKGDVYD
ncbi:NADH-quinone oxidoreductase subunit E [Acidimangrovimonas sediminis]|uniref:NADH-quinone oxidoreductase subunit E n=1 Tax=Acidimangrovimonas sediminis TaxID=2056283 RepID=UPI000C801E91|nr:NADH-quinone oxidoreductase subunit E [Acidimangrovimonas sediminis]